MQFRARPRLDPWFLLTFAACVVLPACSGGGTEPEGDGQGAGGMGGLGAGGVVAGQGGQAPGGAGAPGAAGASGGDGGAGGEGGQSMATGGAGGAGGGTSGGAGGNATGGAAGAVTMPRPPVGPNASPSAACGAGKPSPDGKHTITVNGKQRTFLVRVPKDYDSTHPYRAIFAFHGAGESSDSYDRGFWFRVDVGEKAVLVLPDALWINNNKAMTTWSRDVRDDVAFFDGMLTFIASRACFDTTRVFSTGHSSGAHFSTALGCQRGDVLRAIAPVSGGMRDNSGCRGDVAVWLAHGTKDPLYLPADGRAARDYWVQRNGCSAANPTNTGDANNCALYKGCKDGHPVSWCFYEGTHFWPRSANLGLWNFFVKL